MNILYEMNCNCQMVKRIMIEGLFMSRNKFSKSQFLWGAGGFSLWEVNLIIGQSKVAA